MKHFGKKKQHFKLPEDFSSEENLKSRNYGNFEVVPKCSYQRLPITIWNNDTSYKRYDHLNILPLNSVTRCISKMNSKIKSTNQKNKWMRKHRLVSADAKLALQNPIR